jgi:hypothetical protein
MSPLRYFQSFGMIAIRPPILLYVARAARLSQAALAGKRSMPIKARASTFYRKAQRTAGAIVDLANTFGQLGKVQIRNHHSTLSFIV